MNTSTFHTGRRVALMSALPTKCQPIVMDAVPEFVPGTKQSNPSPAPHSKGTSRSHLNGSRSSSGPTVSTTTSLAPSLVTRYCIPRTLTAELQGSASAGLAASKSRFASLSWSTCSLRASADCCCASSCPSRTLIRAFDASSRSRDAAASRSFCRRVLAAVMAHPATVSAIVSSHPQITAQLSSSQFAKVPI